MRVLTTLRYWPGVKFVMRVMLTAAVLMLFALAGLAMVGVLDAVCHPSHQPDPAWLERYQQYRNPGPGPFIKNV